MNPRWKAISPSQFPWEQDALDYIQRRMPEREPFRAYSNFEFIADDGSINEVDLLVVGRHTVYLVEIKSRPGKVGGDSHTWAWRDGAREYLDDNPLLLNHRKAKKLASLLQRQMSKQKKRAPFVQALVFLSDPAQRCTLTGPARENVHLRKECEDSGYADIVIRLFDENPPVASAQPIDRELASAIHRALEAIGIRPPQKSRRIGDYLLEKVLAETDYHQDWLANHVSLPNVIRRVRLYTARRALPASQRTALADAARREFQLLDGIRHPSILRASDFIDSEHGPALVFDFDPEAQRLDHFVRANAGTLDLWQRLKLVRTIAEALAAAHRHRLYHRGLSPHTVLVKSDAPGRFEVLLFDWQIATRQLQGADGTTTGTLHVEMLSDRAAQEAYLAPEARTAPRPEPIKLDVFALGALAYFVLSGEPPAIDGQELVAKCEAGPGLTLSERVNSCLTEIEELVQFATWPAATDRLESISAFLAALDTAEEAVEDALTAPAESVATSPLDAGIGDIIDSRFRVRRRLGKGATSLALDVERIGAGTPKTGVLKIALEGDRNGRLAHEAATLAGLHHQNIVQCFERFEIGGLAVLYLSSAGDETLAERVHNEGRLGLDLLQRFGEELLGVVDHLETQGVSHRDIKPDNIGIRADSGKRLSLTLFDFSLAETPASDLTAGTRQYLDPFLRGRGLWDSHAERFSCAVTLHEMATGNVPVWGDGTSDPATLTIEIGLDPERFDPAIRRQAVAFFQKALARDVRQRFDNAEQMLRAWRQVFEHIDRPITAHPTQPPQVQLDFNGEQAGNSVVPVPDTAVESLGLTPRQLELIDRIGHDVVATAGDLAELPRNLFYRHRGIALAAARELHQFADRLRDRFAREPVIEETSSPSTPRTGPCSVDAAVARLVPSKGDPALIAALQHWLGLSVSEQSASSQEAGVMSALIERLLRQREITELRDVAADILDRAGGLATVAEVAAALLARRGSLATGAARSQNALVLARALITVEQARQGARWQVFAADGAPRAVDAAAQSSDVVIATVSSAELFPAAPADRAAYARALGAAADSLAQQEPLPPPQQVAEVLASIPAPAGDTPLTAERRLRLAAACAQEAALSSRLEFYPRGMEAARAIKLAASSLVGLPRLDVDTIKKRVAARYPDAAPLPLRPQLDELLREAGLELVWDSTLEPFGAYRLKATTLALSGTTNISRQGTGERGREITAPDLDAARRLDERIQRALATGKMLTLSVEPKYLGQAQIELAHRFSLGVLDLDAIVLDALEVIAKELEIDWNVLVAADAAPPGSMDEQNFATVLHETWPRVERLLLAQGEPALLVNVGLAARWRRMTLFSTLQDACTFGRRPPLVVLIGSPMTPDDRPVLDGQAVPVAINTTDYGRIPRAWLENLHRAEVHPATHS